MSIPSETILVEGLPGEAEILIDRWGIPHITASDETTAFFTQGFNAARDRLWQIDLWRKRGLGLMAEDFGPAYAERDRAARLLMYRGDMAAEWAAYTPEAKGWTEAFVAGVNAYVALTEREPERLPPEFGIMGSKPARWLPEDVLRCRAHARVRNLDAEITRHNIAVKYGMEADRFHKGFQPDWTVMVPEGMDPHPIPAEVLRMQNIGAEPNAINLGTPTLPADLADEGSNHWALAPHRTTTGRPILASDPHRVHEQPSLRYAVHITAPGLNVIGSGEPAVPGITFGHNDDIAFAMTIHPADQEDLYIYELSEDLTRYRYGGGWEAIRTEREPLKVRGEPDREIELSFTRHGPILHVNPETRRAYGLRSVWWEAGTAAYIGALGYLKAKDIKGYLAALDSWGAPSSNHVVAEVAGNIAYAVGTKVPLRPNWDGLMPVPGDGRYEWAGFTTTRDMPRHYNPASGWVGSANQYNLPADFDAAFRRTGFEWTDGARYARLSQVLNGETKFSVASTLALQTDVTSVQAKSLVDVLRAIPGTPSPARALLMGWDHRLSTDSAGGALYEAWFTKHLVPTVMRTLPPEGLAAMVAVPDTQHVTNLVLKADPAFGPEPEKARDALMLSTLEAAFAEVTKLLGPDTTAWAWGTLHQGFAEHPLSKYVSPELAAQLNVGPLPKSGAGSTLNNNGYRPSDFRVTSGVTWRMVVDVGNWDASITVNTPGQSGDPRSPHYRDLFPVWAKDEAVPLLYSRAAIEEAAEARIVLKRG
ncbi:penicillin acylase family protein [Rhodovarius crocodyli]|uniref:Penicillin acylase family protein n=1 Tax=Rhodovarius crocodyli TaxID=1979269 RepID=A0A437M1S9_9PROT|nr:penicillin acylase family protein [Rhodovarius crocodyli]RVT91503.1 penicillin acylase family protein [Rhodovarius crocodyli]